MRGLVKLMQKDRQVKRCRGMKIAELREVITDRHDQAVRTPHAVTLGMMNLIRRLLIPVVHKLSICMAA